MFCKLSSASDLPSCIKLYPTPPPTTPASDDHRYYGVSTFVIANSLASAPFIFLISIISSCIVFWLVNLNDDGDRYGVVLLKVRSDGMGMYEAGLSWPFSR